MKSLLVFLLACEAHSSAVSRGRQYQQREKYLRRQFVEHEKKTCGDGFCSSQELESCITCSEDCGECPTSGRHFCATGSRAGDFCYANVDCGFICDSDSENAGESCNAEIDCSEGKCIVNEGSCQQSLSLRYVSRQSEFPVPVLESNEAIDLAVAPQQPISSATPQTVAQTTISTSPYQELLSAVDSLKSQATQMPTQKPSLDPTLMPTSPSTARPIPSPSYYFPTSTSTLFLKNISNDIENKKCGDGVCRVDDFESCLSCADDCGACPTTGSHKCALGTPRAKGYCEQDMDCGFVCNSSGTFCFSQDDCENGEICQASYSACQQNLNYGLQPSCYIEDSRRYNICLDLLSFTESYEPWMDAFGAAKEKWEKVVIGDLPNRTSERLYETWCTGFPDVIDDCYVCGKEVNIDGSSGILGSAQWKKGRNGGPGSSTVYAGIMTFDSVDIQRMMDRGIWNSLIMHEMGHATLGIGDLWTFNDLYRLDSGVYKSGSKADAEWKAMGCSGPLPVELEGGIGTANVHWEENCLRHEMMTGFLGVDQTTEPLLSRITIASLEDMGYTVNYTEADPFGLEDLGDCVIGVTDYCPAATRSKGGGRRSVQFVDKVKGRRALSRFGRETVMNYAKQNLETITSDSDKDLDGNFIDVIYEEDGEIHIIGVSSEDIR